MIAVASAVGDLGWASRWAFGLEDAVIAVASAVGDLGWASRWAFGPEVRAQLLS